MGERLGILRTNFGAWRLGKDRGQCTLAGAQLKTALLYEKGRWGVPCGRIPTTHILKPPNPRFDGLLENEHFCMELAHALSLPTARSRIMRFGEEIALVIERYDRIHTPGGWKRIHQEDLCQAIGLSPGAKYQADGGPSARTIVELLCRHSSSPHEDIAVFVDALAFSWLIAGTDAHAKNYSLLIGPHGRVRLAPLYDMASVLPYSQFDVNKVKLSMKIGGKYRLGEIGVRQWRKLAEEVEMDADALIARIAHMAEAIPDRVADTSRQMKAAGFEHAIIDPMTTRLVGRSRRCLTELGF